MKKNILFLLLLGFFIVETEAQEVSKRIVVEHYTNTRCGNCANRNPAFFTNLNNHPDVLHIAIYPSSPYPTCVLHLHNQSESDDRTQANSVYGSTPRLVIQGSVVSGGANYGSATIFDPYEGQMTPVSLNVLQSKVDNELIINLTVKAEADNSIGEAKLFIAAVEDLVEYAAPNGEVEHPNVFRKTLNGEADGETINVPAMAGDSIVLFYSIVADAAWDFSQIYAMAILQDAGDRSVLQADASDPSDNVTIVSSKEVNTISAQIYPNPVQNKLTVRLPELESAELNLFNAQGALMKLRTFNGETTLELADLPNGIYWLHVQTESGVAVRKIIRS